MYDILCLEIVVDLGVIFSLAYF